MLGFFWRHKLLTVLLVASFIFWRSNPAQRFGYFKSGVVVFNRIPVVFFDLFVDSAGKMFLEMNLKSNENVKYWFNTHLKQDNSQISQRLIIGYGVSDTISIPSDILLELQNRRFSITQLPSLSAVKFYNACVDSGIPASILLKIN